LKIGILLGDDIGLEVVPECVKVLKAAAARERAELDAAQLNVERQRKLLALGSGRKSEVSRAEQKLAELKTPKD